MSPLQALSPSGDAKLSSRTALTGHAVPSSQSKPNEKPRIGESDCLDKLSSSEERRLIISDFA